MACYPDAEFEDDYHHESSQVLTLSEGGFDDSLFINPPSPSQGFHCPVCLLVLKDPHLLSCCGKHLCRVRLSILLCSNGMLLLTNHWPYSNFWSGRVW